MKYLLVLVLLFSFSLSYSWCGVCWGKGEVLPYIYYVINKHKGKDVKKEIIKYKEDHGTEYDQTLLSYQSYKVAYMISSMPGWYVIGFAQNETKKLYFEYGYNKTNQVDAEIDFSRRIHDDGCTVDDIIMIGNFYESYGNGRNSLKEEDE